MSTDTETQLSRLFQNPLQDFERWKSSVQMLLGTLEPELAHIEVANLLLSSLCLRRLCQQLPACSCLHTAAGEQHLEGSFQYGRKPHSKEVNTELEL